MFISIVMTRLQGNVYFNNVRRHLDRQLLLLTLTYFLEFIKVNFPQGNKYHMLLLRKITKKKFNEEPGEFKCKLIEKRGSYEMSHSLIYECRHKSE